MYEFSIPMFFVGLIILAAGVALVKWHQKIADSLGGGVGSYDRYKLWAFIACGVGLLVMLNIPAFLLDISLGSFFRQD